MRTFKMKIGLKLGLAAAAGMLLVLGMIANQILSDYESQAMSTNVRRSSDITRTLVGVEVNLRELTIQNRALQLAATPEDVDDVAAAIRSIDAKVATTISATMKIAASTATRDDLGAVKDAYGAYVAALLKLADAQRAVIAMFDRQSRDASDWPSHLKAVVDGRDMAAEPNRVEIIRALEQSDAAFKQARLVAWSKLVRPDDVKPAKMRSAFDLVLKLIDEARKMSGGSTLRGEIDKFPPMVVKFRALVDEVQAALDGATAVTKNEADPLRAKADSLTARMRQELEMRAAQDQGTADANAVRLLWVNVAAGVGILLVLAGSAILSQLNVARPIRRVGEVLLALANGDKGVVIPYTERGDEVGDAARAASTFRDNLIRVERLESEQREADARTAAEKASAAEREATEKRAAEERAASERRAAVHRLADAFNTAVGGIIETVSTTSRQLEVAAGTLSKNAELTQHLSQTVAAASEEASTNVQSMASSTEEMTSSVHEISRHVQESSRIAGEAVKQAEQTDLRIAELSHAASRIGEVVKLITAIAEQTNLLALNATIEAARAGDAGRGFAVVAQEVKDLAAQTAKATEEIGGQIAGMQVATEQSVNAIKEIGGTIGKISEIATIIASAVEEQGAATAEVARNIQQAAQGTAEVAGSISELSRGASETGSASAQVLSSARSLAQESNRLKIEVQEFLETVRAA